MISDRTRTRIARAIALTMMAGSVPTGASAAVFANFAGGTLGVTSDSPGDVVFVASDGTNVLVNGMTVDNGGSPATVAEVNAIVVTGSAGGSTAFQLDEASAFFSAVVTLTAGAGAGDNFDIVGSPGADAYTLQAVGGVPTLTRTSPVPLQVSFTGVDAFGILGNGGDDSITVGDMTGVAGPAQLFLLGNDGADTIDAGGIGTNAIGLTIDGGSGDDTLTGGPGVDMLFGQDGADTLDGNPGDDTLNGGPDDDILVWNNGDNSDQMIADAGNDVVVMNGANGGDDVGTLAESGGNLIFDRSSLIPFTLTISGAEQFDFNGQDGNDSLTVGDLTNVMGLGSINFSGSNGADTLDASGLANSAIFAVADGGGDDDILTGGPGADMLDGGDGNDTLTGGRGGDLFSGGAGQDTMIWNNGDGSDVMDGAGDDDVVRMNGSDGGDDIGTLSNVGGNLVFERTSLGPFTLTISNSERFEFNGQAGNDSLTVGDISALPPDLAEIGFEGGDGNDAIDASAAGTGALVVEASGGAGDDTLTGGPGDDSILGGDGIDALAGVGGADTLTGGTGDDTFDGGDGDDTLIWNNGDNSDAMEGGAGSDAVVVNGSGSGDDIATLDANAGALVFARTSLIPFTLNILGSEFFQFNGTGGNDSLTAGDLSTVVFLQTIDFSGGDGLDRFDGELKNNAGVVVTADGGADDDVLIGGRAADTLSGGDGNDVVDGNQGDDAMAGGPGSDILIWNNGDNSDTMDGGDGADDVVQVNGSTTAGDAATLGESAGALIFDRTNLVPFNLNIVNTEGFEFNGGGGDDSFVVGDLTNVVALNRIAADGGDGTDVVDAGGIANAAIAFVATGGAGDDMLTGGPGADLLIGDDGADVIDGNPGDDMFDGGLGDDLLVWNNGDNTDQMNGGDGTDVVRMNGAGAGDDIGTLSEAAGALVFNRISLIPFTLTITNTETFEFNGQGGNDTLTVNDLSALPTLATLGFMGGDDVDLLDAELKNNAAISIVADGGAGNDTLVGGRGADTLAGGDGNDTFDGNQGNDTFDAGPGDDVMVWNNGDGSDVMEGGDGADIARMNGSDGGDDVATLSDNAGRLAFARTSLGPFTLDIGTAETFEFNGQGGNDSLTVNDLSALPILTSIAFQGGDGADTFDGELKNNAAIAATLDGGLGDDTLIGGRGADTIAGGDGNDTLDGNQGNDAFDGGPGDDSMTWNNGDGSDTMNGGDGVDTARMNGSDGGNDVGTLTDISGVLVFERTSLGPFTLNITNSETFEFNGQGGDDSLVVDDLSALALPTAIGFTGGDGNDTFDAELKNNAAIAVTVDGGAGDDTLTGGRGADALAGGDGADTMDGNQGNDSFDGGPGDDVMVWNNGDGSDLMEGGDGNDVAAMNGSSTGGDVGTLTDSDGRLIFERTSLGPFTLTITNSETFEFNGAGGDDSLVVGDLSGLSLPTAINFSGADGNDVFDAELKNNGGIFVVADGGLGDDTLIGGRGDDMLLGGDGADTLDGNQGADMFAGGAGDDSMTWNNGDGSDQMDGGDGADVARMNGSGTGDDVGTLTENGGLLIFARTSLGPFTLTISTAETFEFNGQGGNDSLTVGDLTLLATPVAVAFDGGPGDDAFDASAIGMPVPPSGGVGAAPATNSSGGAGDDMLVGGPGDDTFDGGSGTNAVDGGAGLDSLLVFGFSDVGLSDGSTSETVDGRDTIALAMNVVQVINATLGQVESTTTAPGTVQIVRIESGNEVGPAGDTVAITPPLAWALEADGGLPEGTSPGDVVTGADSGTFAGFENGVPTPSPTATPEPTDSPSPTPTPEVTETPSPTPTPEVTATPEVSPTASPTPSAAILGNLSTRGFVGVGSQVMIGGLIVEGTEPRRVLVSGIGPDLTNLGVQGVLANPVLALLQGQNLLVANDDWMTAPNVSEIEATGFRPNQDLESAILLDLAPGEYTAVLSGVGATEAEMTGVGLVQAFDLGPGAGAGDGGRLRNLSTRIFVGTDDRVMIGGFTIQGGPLRVVVRALGPTLGNPPFSVDGAMADPELILLRDGAVLQTNFNWMEGENATEIMALGLAPPADQEAAVLATLDEGAYTAIVSGANLSSGVALIEVYEAP